MARRRRSVSRVPTGAPLLDEELLTSLPARPARRPLETPTLQVTVPVAAARGATVEAVLRRARTASDAAMLDVLVTGAAIGVHVLPPSIPVVGPPRGARSRRHGGSAIGFDGFLPDHLALRPAPHRLPKALRTPARLRGIRRMKEGEAEATTVFPPDQRYLFQDTAYPWCTVGLVQSPLGSGSGAMVGPRHLLTCNHIIQWNSDNTAGWVKFTPAYFDGSAPFGAAWGTRVYWEGQKVFGPTLDRSEMQHDYVCVVLDRRIGDLTGWMGTRSWSDDWDDEPYWRHIGYPGDLGGQRPSYQRDIALDGSFWDREVHSRIFHQGDVWPGQSGGPFFAWWAGENFPRAVAVQSAQNPDENTASGGAHMVDCVIRARNEHP